MSVEKQLRGFALQIETQLRMSKAALNALTAANALLAQMVWGLRKNRREVMAKVLGPEIIVNAVCPGFIEGRWLREGLDSDPLLLSQDTSSCTSILCRHGR